MRRIRDGDSSSAFAQTGRVGARKWPRKRGGNRLIRLLPPATQDISVRIMQREDLTEPGVSHRGKLLIRPAARLWIIDGVADGNSPRSHGKRGLVPLMHSRVTPHS